MSNPVEIVDLAKEIGLEGDDLRGFVKEKETEQREERPKEREARTRPIRKSLKNRNRERGEITCTLFGNTEVGMWAK